MELDPQTKFYLAIKRIADRWFNYFQENRLNDHYTRRNSIHYLTPEEVDRQYWIAQQITKCGERLQEILMVYEQETEIEKRYIDEPSRIDD